MLQFSQAEAITQAAFRRAMLQGNTQRKEACARKLDYYNDQQETHIQELLERFYRSRANKVAPVSVNVVKKIINLKSTVYLQDAQRTILGTPQDQQIYADIETSTNLAVLMKQANKYTTLLGNIILRPVWRNNRMTLDILTGNVVDVVTGDYPQDVQAVIIEHFDESGRPEEISYSVWTASTVSRMNYAGHVFETEENPYQCLPFVFCFDSPPQGEFWLSGANDLILVQDAINKRLSDLWRTLDFQSYSVGVFRGVSKTDTMQGVELDPGSVICMEHKDSNFDFKSPDAPVEEVLQSIDRLIKWAGITNGVSASSLNTEIVEQSGISRIVENEELQEIRRDQIANFAGVEEHLFQLFRTVWNYHNPQRMMSPSASLRVDFYDPKPRMSVSEKVQELQALFSLGLASPVDFLIEQNPDLDRDAAKAKLQQIRDDLKEFDQQLFV